MPPFPVFQRIDSVYACRFGSTYWYLLSNERCRCEQVAGKPFTSKGSLVRVQLSPPLRSPCRSRASLFCASPRGVLRRYEQLGEHELFIVSGWLSCRNVGLAWLVESRKRGIQYGTPLMLLVRSASVYLLTSPFFSLLNHYPLQVQHLALQYKKSASA